MTPFFLGGKLIMDARHITQTGSNLQVTYSDGTIDTFPQDNAAIATSILSVISNVQLSSPVLMIGSITPSLFNPTTDTVTIYGSGFSPAVSYAMYLEDTVGGKDSNGFSMNCTFVNPQTLIATPSSAGDGSTTATMLIYLLSNTSVYSNIVNATLINTPIGTGLTSCQVQT